jgi:hypothetical protein
MLTIKLPTAVGHLTEYRLRGPKDFPARARGRFNRVAYAAAHVVADPLADVDPWLDVAIDWDRTIAFREHLWDLGLGVAEAMDTAQRGMGLDWNGSLELIRRSLEAAKSRPGALLACGAGTDHLPPSRDLTTDDVIRAYEEQIEAIEAAGGRIILMASRALAACARSPDDYAKVYDRILSQLREPCITTGWARCSIRRSKAISGTRTTWRRWTSASASSRPTPPRSTASSSRCSTRTRRSRCARACPRACACIPATTSTTRS